MTQKEKVINHFRENNSPMCDDCLADKLDFPQRQVANQICRRLEGQGLLLREKDLCIFCHTRKIVNSIQHPSEIESFQPAPSVIKKKDQLNNGLLDGQHAWHWEGHIQTSLVTWLAKNGYGIISVSNTAARNPGKDIIAKTPSGKELWISVKGYPENMRHVQARHYFSGAIFDLLLYRSESPVVELAIGLPDGFSTFTNLSARMSWLKDNLPFRIFWVSENGDVHEE